MIGINQQLAKRVMDLILNDPEVTALINLKTESFLERPKHRDKPDENWESCRRTVVNLLLLDVIRYRP